MENDDATTKSCLEFRSQYEDCQSPQSGVPDEQRTEVLTHFGQCRDCKIWHQQMTAIEMTALSIPQFDVQETVTQRILASLENERHRAIAPRDVALLVVSIAAFSAFLVVMPMDSLDGAVSWVIGFAILAAMNFLKYGAISSRRTQAG